MVLQEAVGCFVIFYQTMSVNGGSPCFSQFDLSHLFLLAPYNHLKEFSSRAMY